MKKLSNLQEEIILKLKSGGRLSRNITANRGEDYQTWIVINNDYKRISPRTVEALIDAGYVKEINRTWQGSEYVLTKLIK